MSIASDERPVWGESEPEDESVQPHSTLPDSDEEMAAAAERIADAEALAAAAALAGGPGAMRGPDRNRRHNIHRPFPYLLGPHLRPEDGPRVVTLADEIFRATRGRGRFATFPRGEFTAAATILARYRIPSLEILRQTKKEARQMFLRDLREIERLSFPEMQLLLQILGHFPARLLLVRPNAKGPAFEEIAIPERLEEFKADLSSIGGFLKPTQEMANFIILELARGRSKVPAYTPFIVPDVSAAPWAISS